MDSSNISEILKLVWPILVLQYGLTFYALYDLIKRKKVKNLSVPVWAVIIVIVNLIGPIVYLLFGRLEEE